MKKLLSLILIFIMLALIFTGCKKSAYLPNWLSGSDAARLLLANERLNAQLLKNDGDIFENGVEVMNNLANTASENLNVRYTGNTSPSVVTLSSATPALTVLSDDYSGKAEINGDTVLWSEFAENNNSYDAFKNRTEHIITTAEIGAELIDNIKKNVRVVDKWVDVYGMQYYLNVDENSETLCERDTQADIIKICRRYKNENGQDVYEIFFKEANLKERMTYIPGERYELSMINGDGSEDYFVADNSKGYWEIYVVGVFSDHYNVSYFVMKNDICYDAFYEPKDGTIPLLKVMSADRATDILNFTDHDGASTIELKFSGFDGIKYVKAPSSAVEYAGDEYVDLPSGEGCEVHLTNGKTLAYGTEFADGKILLNGIHVTYIGGFGYIGDISLMVQGDTHEEYLQNLKIFLNETGLQCRCDINGVLSGISKAYDDLESVIKYYLWNGVSVTDENGIGEAIKKEKLRFDDMQAIYTAIEDVEVLDFSDTELIELNIKFAALTESSFNNITIDGTKVSVDEVSLTIEDTTLYVNDEPYRVAFALADANGKLVHLEATENTQSTKYADEDKFTVTASALEFTLPVLSPGNYTLVAYIATSDGIRASAYTPATINNTANLPVSVDNISISAAKGSDGVITLTYEQAKDFTVTITSPSPVGYEEFKTLLLEMAFEYGIPSETIEVKSGDTYTALTASDAEIANGTYRISYDVENGDSVVQGYIYVEYTCE